jgi:hypothetical protein
VNAYLSDTGNQVKVDWIPSPNDTGALLGYFIYRTCDNQEPVQVNTTMLSPEAASFVDSSTLKSGKIYTYYVVACYDNGGAKYVTMNSKTSSVVWGVPQLSGGMFTGSMLGNGSLPMALAMAALGTSVTSIALTTAYKKKMTSAKSEDEEQEDTDDSVHDL